MVWETGGAVWKDLEEQTYNVNFTVNMSKLSFNSMWTSRCSNWI